MKATLTREFEYTYCIVKTENNMGVIVASEIDCIVEAILKREELALTSNARFGIEVQYGEV